MNKEILEAKKQLNDYIKYYEDVCERKGIIPIFTRSDKQNLKVLLEHIDTLENQVKNQKVKDNWNKLKDCLYVDKCLYIPEIARNSTYQKVLDKMEEMEKVEK